MSSISLYGNALSLAYNNIAPTDFGLHITLHITMRCYFNLVSDDETMLDDDGVEVRDLDQAWAQALKAIAELRAEAGEDFIDWDQWRLEATDSMGKVLFSIKLTYGLH